MHSFENWGESSSGTGFCEFEKRGGALCSACCGLDGLGWSKSFTFVGK